MHFTGFEDENEPPLGQVHEQSSMSCTTLAHPRSEAEPANVRQSLAQYDDV
jgi:hypothetical protein